MSSLTAGVIGAGAAGGAVSSASGDIIRQTGYNFDGICNLDWKSVGISAAAGGVSGAASAGVGIAMSGVHIPVNINGTVIESPIVSSFLAGTVTGAASHIAGGTTAGLLWGDNLDTAFRNSFAGIGASVLMGGAFSAASTAAYNLADGINPLNGKPMVKMSASDLGLESEVDRILSGKKYTFTHDSTPYYNKDGILPSGPTYMEYVVPPTSGQRAGTARIIVSSNGEWYYTPDHHITFIPFKP